MPAENAPVSMALAMTTRNGARYAVVESSACVRARAVAGAFMKKRPRFRRATSARPTALNASQPACEWNPPSAMAGHPDVPMTISTAMRSALTSQIASAPTRQQHQRAWKAQLPPKEPEVDRQERQQQADALVTRARRCNRDLERGRSEDQPGRIADDVGIDDAEHAADDGERVPRQGRPERPRSGRRSARPATRARGPGPRAFAPGPTARYDRRPGAERDGPRPKCRGAEDEPGADPERRMPAGGGRVKHHAGGLDEQPASRRDARRATRVPTAGGNGAATGSRVSRRRPFSSRTTTATVTAMRRYWGENATSRSHADGASSRACESKRIVR